MPRRKQDGFRSTVGKLAVIDGRAGRLRFITQAIPELRPHENVSARKTQIPFGNDKKESVNRSSKGKDQAVGLLVLSLMLVAGPGWSQQALIQSDSGPGNSIHGDQSLLLEVYVNGQATGKIGEFTQRDLTPGSLNPGSLNPGNKELMVRRNELTDLGFRQPGPLKLRDAGAASFDEMVPLSEISGLALRIDAVTQTLYITMPNDRLVPTSLEAEGALLPGGKVRIESSTGATLNYDLTSTLGVGTLGIGQKSVGATLDLRAFSPRGVFSSGLLGYANSSIGGGPVSKTLVRLDTMYTFGDVGTLRRYTLGDFITTGLSWTRPVRLEGAQMRSDFSMRPDLVTFPLPSVRGAVAVPSAVDVMTNGNLAISRQIDAGPFEIPQLPVVSGAGTISLTLTNALGQQVHLSQPFYASAALLRPALTSYSVQAGLVRLGWGVASNEYGSLAASTTYRRGITPKFTLEGVAEGTVGTMMAGGGGLLQIGTLGVLNFALAGSGGASGTGGQSGAGGQATLGAQRMGRSFSAGASIMAASAGFKDVAARNGDPVSRRQEGANVSFSLKRAGSLGIFYAGTDQISSVNPVTQSVTPAQNTRVLSASYSRPLLGHMAFFVNAFADLSGGSRPGVQIGLTIPWGRRQSAELSASSDGNIEVQVQRSATAVGEWGYQAYVAGGDGSHEFAEAQYKARSALLTAGVDIESGAVSARLETQGAVSLVDEGIFASNTIYDSFAIVDTGTTGGIHVLQENREVGSTGRSGRLLVPDLRAYDVNRLAIVPTDMGLDTTIQEAKREVRPQDRSGIVVKFEVKISHSALLQLVDEAGEPMPVGSSARLVGGRKTVPVGYDGDAYLEDLQQHSQVEVVRPDGRTCLAGFDYKAVPGEIPRIGPVECADPQAGPMPNRAITSDSLPGTDLERGLPGLKVETGGTQVESKP